ncbi:hypothetical protein ES703_107947 [subsurface metagenome]
MGKGSLFTPAEVHKIVGEASHACRIKLLKEGRYGAKMTTCDFKAHKDCVRDFFEVKVKEKITALV